MNEKPQQPRRLQKSIDKTNQERSRGPNAYQATIAFLVLAVVVIGLFALQETNSLRVQNSQLLSHSSSQDQQFVDLNKILRLEKTEVLANHTTVDWPGFNLTMPVEEHCNSCFQYSGYLKVNWTANAASLRFKVVQFHLGHTTEAGPTGDYSLPVSSADSVQMEFDIVSCPGSGCGQLTYNLVYHY